MAKPYFANNFGKCRIRVDTIATWPNAMAMDLYAGFCKTSTGYFRTDFCFCHLTLIKPLGRTEKRALPFNVIKKNIIFITVNCQHIKFNCEGPIWLDSRYATINYYYYIIISITNCIFKFMLCVYPDVGRISVRTTYAHPNNGVMAPVGCVTLSHYVRVCDNYVSHTY